MALTRLTAGLKAVNATKRYILSTLLATIAVALLVTVSFVILSPARIKFSVVHCGPHRRVNNGSSVAITFTVAANNTSRRAAVVYQSMFVDLILEQRWSTANVTTEMPLLQSPAGGGALMTTFDVLVIFADQEASSPEYITSDETTGNFTVKVTSMARFKVGAAWTRRYDIMVSCGPADIFNPHRVGTWPVNCA